MAPTDPIAKLRFSRIFGIKRQANTAKQRFRAMLHPRYRQMPSGAGRDLRAGGSDPFIRQIARIGEGHAREGFRHFPIIHQPMQGSRIIRAQGAKPQAFCY
jgi:hypothetical protein